MEDQWSRCGGKAPGPRPQEPARGCDLVLGVLGRGRGSSRLEPLQGHVLAGLEAEGTGRGWMAGQRCPIEI